MGSVQFQTVPCFSFYFFSRSIGPFQCLINVKYRVLICCTCHLQSSSLFFILASSVCKSLQCLISTLTQGGEGGHLFRLTCSVVLWGGGHCKQISLVCVGGSSQCMDHIRLAPAHGSGVCFPVYTARAPGCSAGVLSKANPAFMHFPGLNCSGSGSWALRMGTDSVGCAFRALPRSEQLR